MMLQRRPQRSGSTLVESAIVYPLVFLLIFAIMLVGTAVFRYQQIAHMAREGARWAAVHGARYYRENPTGTEGTAANVYTYGVKPQTGGLNIQASDVAVTWTASNEQSSTTVVNGELQTKRNYVRVQVNYVWNSGIFGTYNMSSSAIMTINY